MSCGYCINRIVVVSFLSGGPLLPASYWLVSSSFDSLSSFHCAKANAIIGGGFVSSLQLPPLSLSSLLLLFGKLKSPNDFSNVSSHSLDASDATLSLPISGGRGSDNFVSLPSLY